MKTLLVVILTAASQPSANNEVRIIKHNFQTEAKCLAKQKEALRFYQKAQAKGYTGYSAISVDCIDPSTAVKPLTRKG